MTSNMTVQWERRGKRIYLRTQSYSNTADEGSPAGAGSAQFQLRPGDCDFPD